MVDKAQIAAKELQRLRMLREGKRCTNCFAACGAPRLGRFTRTVCAEWHGAHASGERPQIDWREQLGDLAVRMGQRWT